MRYNLESTLPINAFSPRGGRSPFTRGMTLEGGGGGGILKPVTNVLGGAAKAITGGVKAITQPIYNATLRNIPGVDNALVGLDKAVGKSIPGGWGTVASVASSFIPGSAFATNGLLSAITKTQLATGLGALSGSGVMRGKNEFNLQGAIMGGAMAYGASQLSDAFQQAGNATTKSIEEAAKSGVTEGGSSALAGTGSAAAEGASKFTPTANAMSNVSGLPNVSDYYKPPVPSYTPSLGDFAPSGSFGSIKDVAAGAGDFGLKNLASAPSGLGYSAPAGVLDKIASGASDIAGGTLSNMGTAGQGALNLAGLGADGSAAAAREVFTGAASPITKGGLAGLIMGGTGLAALEEQQKFLDEQASSGAISNAEYNAAKAKIDAQVATARATVAANPLQSSADISSVSEGPSLYDKLYAGSETLYDKNPSGGTTLYAMGGAVNPFDDQTGMPNQTPMQRLENKGIMGYASGGSVQSNGDANFGQLASFLTNANIPRFGDQDVATNPLVGGGGLLNRINGIGNLPAGNLPNFSDVNATPQPLGGLFAQNTPQLQVPNAPIFNSSTYQSSGMSPNSGSSSGSYPNSYGGSGGSGGAFPLEGQYGIVKMARGGMAPRFLSGGGDGMSDSIKASINGTQEARLADGEFVIPADVVSHIGNGSSKAGAKQLYSMMDRVRQARVGNKKQGKQINPRKYLAA